MDVRIGPLPLAALVWTVVSACGLGFALRALRLISADRRAVEGAAGLAPAHRAHLLRLARLQLWAEAVRAATLAIFLAVGVLALLAPPPATPPPRTLAAVLAAPALIAGLLLTVATSLATDLGRAHLLDAPEGQQKHDEEALS